MFFVQDEGIFGRISGVRHSWSPTGIRPNTPRQIVRKYLYAYAAVCPNTGEMVSLVLPRAGNKNW